MALGSGSRPNRRLGALLGLDAQGAVRGSPQVVDCSPILASLDREVGSVNIEGAVVSGSELRLFQRGNKRNSENAVIRFQLSTFLDALSSGQAAAIAPIAIKTFDLGQVDGIPLCFTDAVALPDGRMAFTAVAEGVGDNYHDGACAGAAVGVVGKLQCLYPLDWPHKVEGVNARVEGDVIRLLLVSDADDFEIPAALFSASIAK